MSSHIIQAAARGVSTAVKNEPAAGLGGAGIGAGLGFLVGGPLGAALGAAVGAAVGAGARQELRKNNR